MDDKEENKSNELKHYGVPGMHWGVRKAREAYRQGVRNRNTILRTGSNLVKGAVNQGVKNRNTILRTGTHLVKGAVNQGVKNRNAIVGAGVKGAKGAINRGIKNRNAILGAGVKGAKGALSVRQSLADRRLAKIEGGRKVVAKLLSGALKNGRSKTLLTAEGRANAKKLLQTLHTKFDQHQVKSQDKEIKMFREIVASYKAAAKSGKVLSKNDVKLMDELETKANDMEKELSTLWSAAELKSLRGG
jgi:hypothetical protein